MKFRKLLGGGLLAAVLALGGVAGLATRSESKSVSAADIWRYAGSDTGKTATAWKGSSTHYFTDGVATPSSWQFVNTESFKIVSEEGGWGDEYWATLGGTASSMFNGGKWTNSNNESGNADINYLGTSSESFAVSLSDGVFYANYTTGNQFCYVGSESDWKSRTDADHIITVGGPAVSFDFVAGEKFQLRLLAAGENWRGALTAGSLSSSYYNIFSASGNDIEVHLAGTYNVSLALVDGEVKINIVAASTPSQTAYCLDLFNNRLQVARHAHYFHVDGDDYTIGTDWPGVEMATYSNRVYSFSYWTAFDTVIFNNGNSGYGNQTGDIAIEAGKCYVLKDWDAGQWILLEAAQFIDNYLKFTSIPLDNEGSTADCAANYSAAKSAYNSLSSNAVRKEVLKVDVALDRLSAWAEANHGTIDPDGGQITPRAFTNPIIEAFSSDNSTPIMLVVIISVVSLTAVGGYIFLKRRKED